MKHKILFVLLFFNITFITFSQDVSEEIKQRIISDLDSSESQLSES